MTTFTLPPSQSAMIGAGIAAYIENYMPTTIAAAQWATVQPAVCELVARTEPTSRTDARTVLSALCRFMAWAEPIVGSSDLNVMLTSPMVERFADELEGDISDGGRDNHRGRLRRCLRVMAGEPARTKRGPRPTGAEPYAGDDISALTSAARSDDRLARAIASSLSGGTSPSSSLGVRNAQRLSRADWEAARRAACSVGVNLTQDRLRATWLHRLLQRPVALATLVRDEKLSRRDLENAMHHLPQSSPDHARELLRG